MSNIPMNKPQFSGEHAAHGEGVTIESTVESWVEKELSNSVFSRDVDIWNHLQSKLPLLIAELKKL